MKYGGGCKNGYREWILAPLSGVSMYTSVIVSGEQARARLRSINPDRAGSNADLYDETRLEKNDVRMQQTVVS
ncbi:unnamed protein product [Acanthoscelides obtectus]|uniref:Uncharacterized protein n=1 Tax=Acanthoscelides obtectus TaxID=200917 RepID=A0A9P0KMQ0_ACAOB|nr:unnamed protein product [Acanthoscelides obtectus]CAK1653730.1 hypothetical protein AOBTE_LOCUS18346 [Acanthoscelides obtectus]